MFGKPQWFRPKTFGFGLVPVSWPGWLYAGAWMSAIALPFLVLLGRHQAVEAMLWMLAAVCGLIWDVWHIWRASRPLDDGKRSAAVPSPAGDSVLYILDNPPGQTIATRNYQLQVRR